MSRVLYLILSLACVIWSAMRVDAAHTPLTPVVVLDFSLQHTHQCLTRIVDHMGVNADDLMSLVDPVPVLNMPCGRQRTYSDQIDHIRARFPESLIGHDDALLAELRAAQQELDDIGTATMAVVTADVQNKMSDRADLKVAMPFVMKSLKVQKGGVSPNDGSEEPPLLCRLFGLRRELMRRTFIPTGNDQAASPLLTVCEPFLPRGHLREVNRVSVAFQGEMNFTTSDPALMSKSLEAGEKDGVTNVYTHNPNMSPPILYGHRGATSTRVDAPESVTHAIVCPRHLDPISSSQASILAAMLPPDAWESTGVMCDRVIYNTGVATARVHGCGLIMTYTLQ